MATTDETLRLAGDLRIFIDEQVNAATRDIIAAWAGTWQNLSLEWGLAYRPLIIAQATGKKPSRTEIMRAEQTTRALVATRRAIQELTEYAGVRILQPVDVIVERAAQVQAQIIASQLPTGTAATEVKASLQRVDEAQLKKIVDMTTTSVTSLTKQLPAFARQAINAELVAGVALGRNPRAVARNMVTAAKLVQSMNVAFMMPANRALIIARTEMLDAYRGAAYLGQAANADVLAGWQWLAKLDSRSCPSCWAQHGTVHPITTPGPLDHQQGRCARMPLTKSWKDLGFDDLDEPDSIVPDAQSTFDGLSEKDQLRIMGRDRLKALRDGDIGWTDLSTKRSTLGWRDSYVVTPVAATRAARGSTAA